MNDLAPEAEGQAASAAPDSEGQAATQPVWYDSAPDEVKGYIQNKGWDNPIKAVESYQKLEKFQGADENSLIKLPKEDDIEGWGKVYNKLGRPETPDGYKKSLPEGASIDDARLNVYTKIAHETGITQKQFEALAKADNEYMASVMEAHEKERVQKQEDEYQALIKEWGKNASEREELSRRGARALMPEGVDKEEILSKIEDAIGTAMTLKLFANAGDRLTREDKIPDSAENRSFGYTKEQAAYDKKALMSELSADPTRLANYNQGKGPDYDKMQRLLKVLANG